MSHILVKVLSGYSHVVCRFKSEDPLEELHGERHVGGHVLNRVQRGAHAVGRRLVQVCGCLISLLQRSKKLFGNGLQANDMLTFITLYFSTCKI